jgi:nitronate monooxygenase
MSTLRTPAPHWLQHRFGLALPLLQAPMAGSQDHRLAVAVASAGGLGALAGAMFSPEALAAEITAFRQAVDAPLNVNVFCHQPPDPTQPDVAAALDRWEATLAPQAQRLGLDPQALPRGAGRLPFSAEVAAVLEQHRPEVVSFHFGLPAPELLARVKATGAVVLSSATTVAEARWLVQHGADAVIAQGLEAGGHRGHFLSHDLSLQSGLLALLPQVVQAVGVPVIAAGGITTPQAVAAAQALGASAVQVGTAFLVTPEATTAPLHRAALAQAQTHQRPTALTNLFTGRPARGLVNRVMAELGPLSPDAPPFPLATAAMTALRTASERQGLDDHTPLWAGQAAALAVAQPAADVARRLAAAWL